MVNTSPCLALTRGELMSLQRPLIGALKAGHLSKDELQKNVMLLSRAEVQQLNLA